MLFEFYETQPLAFYIFLSLFSYFIGSFPTAYIACKRKGIDIRTVGSGNVGATNAGRILGKKWGFFILFIDALKGYVPASLSLMVTQQELVALYSGTMAVIGHVFPVWIGFRGGKGVATGFGMMLALLPEITLLAVVVFAITVLISRYVSLGSILGALSLLVFYLLFYNLQQDFVLFLLLLVMVSFVIYRHRANIRRLVAGEEPKIWQTHTKE
ncbi:MAG: glycerol-3-phosphate 1-O-acyltransferase PlsY [Leptospiraceae bacterium]|nr:glycerol-3-phosphate 1-O-acyltransferase PlsY [Leptospiraceae bacterium]MDW8306961.1 glycerol-3-phosphate 1-O-acyltransferase PlsY [Leptospiraceae bacterium]